MRVQIQKEGFSFSVDHIRSEVKRDLNKENVARVSVVRGDVQGEIEEGQDELKIKDGDGNNVFGGVIEDVDKQDALTEFFVESFERYARDAEPVPAGFGFDDATDEEIIVEALKEVDRLKHGDSEDEDLIRQVHDINTTDDNLEITYHHTSPARIIRKMRDITGGEVLYRPDKSILYTDELGSDKSDTTISPRRRNVSDISVRRRGGEETATHLRMLGAGNGETQAVAEVVADQYDPENDIEKWTTETDSSISNTNTLAKEGRRIIEEKYEVTVDVNTVVRGVDVNLGDYFTIDYPEEDIENRVMRAVEVNEIHDREGHRYEATFSNVHQDRQSKDEEISERVEQASREEDQIVGLPIYANLSSAPERLGVIYITGEDEDPQGIYRYDQNDDEFKRGSNSNIAELSDRNLRGNNITDDEITVYNSSNEEVSNEVIPEIQRKNLPSEIGSIENYPLKHSEDLDTPPSAHHEPPKVDVGILTSDPDRAPNYIEFVETEFEPKYIEFHTLFHEAGVGQMFEEDEDEERIKNGYSHGYGTGDADSDQVVAMQMNSPDVEQANKSYVDNGYVGYIAYEEHQGAGFYETKEVSLQIYSIINDGFRVVWTDNDFQTPVIYKAFK